jgi:hypothetical protein
VVGRLEEPDWWALQCGPAGPEIPSQGRPGPFGNYGARMADLVTEIRAYKVVEKERPEGGTWRCLFVKVKFHAAPSVPEKGGGGAENGT